MRFVRSLQSLDINGTYGLARMPQLVNGINGSRYKDIRENDSEYCNKNRVRDVVIQ